MSHIFSFVSAGEPVAVSAQALSIFTVMSLSYRSKRGNNVIISWLSHSLLNSLFATNPYYGNNWLLAAQSSFLIRVTCDVPSSESVSCASLITFEDLDFSFPHFPYEASLVDNISNKDNVWIMKCVWYISAITDKVNQIRKRTSVATAIDRVICLSIICYMTKTSLYIVHHCVCQNTVIAKKWGVKNKLKMWWKLFITGPLQLLFVLFMRPRRIQTEDILL